MSLADFRRMLATAVDDPKAAARQTTTVDYRIDDGSIEMTITGMEVSSMTISDDLLEDLRGDTDALAVYINLALAEAWCACRTAARAEVNLR